MQISVDVDVDIDDIIDNCGAKRSVKKNRYRRYHKIYQ